MRKLKKIKEPKIGDQLRIRLPADFVTRDGPALLENIGSTMTLLEQAIDSLIQRINTQTQRIKDMM